MLSFNECQWRLDTAGLRANATKPAPVEMSESIRMRKLLNEALKRNRLFVLLMLAVIKIFQIDNFLRDFDFNRISSLNISALYM